MAKEAQPLRVAISGGGLASATLLHALGKYPHVDAHIFEVAPAFRETGAAIGVSETGLQSLELIGPSAVESLARAGAVKSRGVRWFLAAGPDAGSMIADDELNERNRRAQIVHRAEFLREMLAATPAERMHASKRLTRIAVGTGASGDGDGSSAGSDGGAEPITLHFEDGTTHECDVLVGADGIRSFVRTFVVGNDGDAAVPRRADWWAVQTLRPYHEARASLEEKFVDADDPITYAWVGDGAFVMHNILSGGDLVQIVVSVPCKPDERPDPSTSIRQVNADELEAVVKDWPSHISKAVRELLCNEPVQTAIYLRDHLPASSYVRGNVCVIGDAAHTMTPWQGSGAVVSLEDALILSTLLGKVKTPGEAQIALQTYDQMRRPRTQRVVESSYSTGVIITGRDPAVGLDLEMLKRDLVARWDFILTLDMAKHQSEALEMLEAALQR